MSRLKALDRCVLWAGCALAVGVGQAAERIKADVATNLNVGASWVGGAVPGVGDYGKWTSTVTGPNASPLGGNMSVQGFVVANPAGPVGIGGTNTLTISFVGFNLNAATVDMAVTNQRVALLDYSTPYWVVPAGRTLTVSPAQINRGAGAGLGVFNLGTVLSAALANDATGIVGPWAWYNASGVVRYASVAGGAVQGYAAGVSAATAAAVTDTTGMFNYDVGAVGTLGAGAAFNTLRYEGVAGTIAGGFAANGLMNASSSGGLTMSGNATVGASRELVVVSPSAGRPVTLSGVVSDDAGGASGVTLTGGGVLNLTGSNTYSGVTSVGAGVVYINKASSLGTTSGSTVIFVNGSSVTGGAVQVAGTITLAEPITFVGTGDGAPWNSAMYVPGAGGTNTIVGPITIQTTGGVRISGSGNGTGLNLNGSITRTSSGNTLIIGAGGAGGFVNIYGPINNNGGSLTTHNGPGIVRLYSQTNNIGALNVQTYHTVQLNVNDALVSGCSLQVGGASNTSGDQARGVFDMNGFSQTINSFNGDGVVAEPPTVRVVTNSAAGLGVLTVGSSGGSGSFNGHIDGNIMLVKNGTGVQTNRGPNRYTGGTVVNAGVLVASNLVNHGALAVNGGLFRFAPSMTVNGSLSGSGGVIDLGAAGNVLTVNQATNSTFAGALTNQGSLVKSGAGALTLSGANTFSGGTTVSQGTLVFARPAALPASGGVAVAAGAGAGLGIGGVGTYTQADVDSLWAGTLPGVTLDPASLIGIDTSVSNATYATSQSTRGLVKTGTNTLTLTGVNTYPGGTFVQAGVLSIPQTDALPGWDTNGRFWVSRDAGLAVGNAVSDADFSTITGTGNFANGGCVGFDTTVSNRTYAAAIGNTVNGALGLVKVGLNTLTLSGDSSYDGPTIVSGGTLTVRHSNALGSANGYTVVSRAGGTPPNFTDGTGQVRLDGSAVALTLGENFFITGSEQYGYGGAIRNAAGNNAINGWIVLGPSGRIGVDAGSLTLNGPVLRTNAASSPMLVLNANTGVIVVSNRIDIGAGLVNCHSGGTSFFCSTNNVWGYMQIQYGGVAKLGMDESLCVGKRVVLGNNEPGNGRLDLNGFRQTVGGLQEYGTAASKLNNIVTNSSPAGSATLVISQPAGANDTFGGRIGGAINIVVSSAPTAVQTLWGTNSLFGAIAVNSGGLTLSPTGAFGAGCTNVTVAGGTLTLQNSSALPSGVTLQLPSSGSGKVSLAAGVNQPVAYLFVNGQMRRAGTYGSTSSPATTKDDALFAGAGVLTVTRDNSGTLLKLW